MDYKGQERSNLVFSEFRRSFLTAKLFYSITGLPEGKPVFLYGAGSLYGAYI